MMYQVDDVTDQMNLTIRTGDEPPDSLGFNVIGTWDGSVIRLYLDRISSNDMLFSVRGTRGNHANQMTPVTPSPRAAGNNSRNLSRAGIFGCELRVRIVRDKIKRILPLPRQ